MRISDWSSDVCSSDLCGPCPCATASPADWPGRGPAHAGHRRIPSTRRCYARRRNVPGHRRTAAPQATDRIQRGEGIAMNAMKLRSEEHTSELQSLMRISYAVFCLKKKHTQKQIQEN